MYNIEELSSKSLPELEEIAKELSVSIDSNANQQDIIYALLDEQAKLSAKSPQPAAKRKRTRIVKKDTDRVYSVSGKEGENFDLKKNRSGNEPMPLFKELPADAETVEDVNETSPVPEAIEQQPAPKKTGRKTKKETVKEVEDAAEAVEAQPEVQPAELTADENVENLEVITSVEEEQESFEENNENMQSSMEGETGEPSYGDEEVPEFDGEDPVWADDPADGTDFITVVDLPIEDHGAMPSYDIFDNPTTPLPSENVPVYEPEGTGKYDFDDIITANGVLEVMPDGYGFLRSSDYNYLSSPDDVYISVAQRKRYGLKTGNVVNCRVRPPHDGEKYFPLTAIDTINGRSPSEVRDRIPFEHLTPLFPDTKYTLCGDKATTNLSTRIVDLFAPIGKGQRALIVAQPKTGKTILMKDIANAIAANHPEAYLMMLLIDERPEEVTDMARTVNAEVIASTFDEPAERHVKIAGIVLEKAKRMVECGHDVVIFLDSITRLARAYNTVAPASGKVLTGGVDANALQKPKRFFGAARNIEDGGSLTIIATALIDTGSKMDEVIFEEFKGTGNMELQLDRSLSNKRIFPAVNLVASSTRRDDLLHDKTTLDRMWILRKYISDMNAIEAMNTIHDSMERTNNNEEFLLSMNS